MRARRRRRDVFSAKVPIAAFVLTLVQGCSTAPLRLSDDAPHTAIPSDRVAARSDAILLLGDTQEHTLEGLPHGFLTGVIDKVVADVTIRPPQQALFGRKLFQVAVAGSGAPRIPAVHLGDVADHSCEIEIERMFRAIAQTGLAVAIAPGNHDGAFQGIFNPPDETAHWGFSSVGWDYVCRQAVQETPDAPAEVMDFHRRYAAGEPPVSNLMSKDRYVQAYLTHLTDRGLAAPTVCEEMPEIRCLAGSGLIEAVYARTVPREVRCANGDHCRNFSESFVVQTLRLTPPGAPVEIAMVLIDTTDLDLVFRPDFFEFVRHLAGTPTYPGSRGYVHSGQLQVIKRIVAQARQTGRILVFAGHHNWEQMEESSRERLAQMMQPLDHPAVYLSAHTHRGYWAKFDIGGRSLTEFNVSSIADWPIDSRRLTLAVSDDRSMIEIRAGSDYPQGASTDDHLLALWEARTCRHPEAQGVLERPDEFIRTQRRIAREHRRDSGGFADAIGASIANHITKLAPGSLADHMREIRNRSLYVANLNDVRKAIQAFAIVLEHSPAIDRWITSLGSSIKLNPACKTGTLAARLACTVEHSHDIGPVSAHGTRKAFVALSATVGDLQRIVDAANIREHPGIVRTMACAHVVAAHEDWGIGQERERLIDRPFFETIRLAR